jgi:hypothetical protein
MPIEIKVVSNTVSPHLLKLVAALRKGSQAEIGYGSRIANYQHFGTSRGIPPRKLVPDAGMPGDWEGFYRQQIEGVVESLDLRGALERIAQYSERQIKLNFDRDSDPYGSGWTGLAPSTIKQKKNPKMLQETGGMINSLNSQVS